MASKVHTNNLIRLLNMGYLVELDKSGKEFVCTIEDDDAVVEYRSKQLHTAINMAANKVWRRTRKDR